MAAVTSCENREYSGKSVFFHPLKIRKMPFPTFCGMCSTNSNRGKYSEAINTTYFKGMKPYILDLFVLVLKNLKDV